MQNKLKASKGITLEQIKQKFEKASDLFYKYYRTIYTDEIQKDDNEIEFI